MRSDEDYSPTSARAGLIAFDDLRSPTLVTDSPAKKSPFTQYRRRPPADLAWTWITVLLPALAHALLSLCTALALRFYVDQRKFNIHQHRPVYTDVDGQTSHLPFNLLQTDITTILSAGIAFIRFFGALWTAGVSWRCAFIILEKDRMRLRDFDRLASQSLLSLLRPVSSRSSFPHHVIILLLFILTLPPQYAAPILTGSITWIPDVQVVHSRTPLTSISTTIYGPGPGSWDWYLDYSDNRNRIRVRAAGLASTAWSGAASLDVTEGLMKRVISGARNLSANSTLSNVTVPFFTMHSLTWLTPADVIAESNDTWISRVSNGHGYSNFSTPDNPLAVIAPTLGFSFPVDWDAASADFQTWPAEFRFINRTDLLVVLANRNVGTECATWSDAFGPFPPNAGSWPLVWTPRFGDAKYTTTCYIFANVTYSAGVVECHDDCVLAGNGVLQSHISTLAPSLASSSASDDWLHEVQSDSLVYHALRMTPEVILTMAQTNASIPDTWDNLEGYASEMLSRSYAASWNALTDVFGTTWSEPWSEQGSGPQAVGVGPGAGLSTSVNIAVPAIRASVSRRRLCIWIGLQSGMLLSCFLFIALHTTTTKRLVKSPVTEVLLFDTTELRVRAGLEPATGGGVYHPESRFEYFGLSAQNMTPIKQDERPPLSPLPQSSYDTGFIHLTKADGLTVIHYTD